MAYRFRGRGKFPRWVLLGWCIAVGSAGAAPLRVGFLCPAPIETPFWAQVIRVMEAVAGDLQIELVIKCSQRGTLATKRTGIELLNTEPKLDYFISGYWPSVTRYHLQLAEQAGIKSFIINATVANEDIGNVGRPREKFSTWVGHMAPDDKVASRQLLEILVDRVKSIKRKGPNDRINVFSFTGIGASPVAVNRTAGLLEGVKAIPNVDLHTFAGENWIADWVEAETAKLWKDYPDVDVIWAANEATAWGAMRGVERAGKIPGVDVMIGGFDWNPDSIKAIADGRITASMFGHFMEGAWALLLVHDHYHGFDFAKDKGTVMSTPLTSINAANYDRYAVILEKAFWEGVDFRKFSKKYNPGLKSYNFNINQFLN